MAIEMENPEDFLVEFRDPNYFTKILEAIWQRKKIASWHTNTNISQLGQAIQRSQNWLWQQNNGQPFWAEPIESNASLSAQFILMSLGMGDPNQEQREKLFRYILTKSDSQGLYPLYYGGPDHYSINLLIYLAGRAMGYSADSPELRRLYSYLSSQDIFTKVNMETRLLLAVYGLISWDCVPPIPSMFVLIPPTADFSIYSIAYWVRTSLVPMAILQQQHFSLPHLPIKSEEILNLHPQKQTFPLFQSNSRIWDIFLRNIRKTYAISDISLEKLAIAQCEKWILDHQDRSGDWGGIYPAMQYSLLALYALGYTKANPCFAKAWEALQRFQKEIAPTLLHQQSCVSPVWDTAWAIIALSRSGWNLEQDSMQAIFQWLLKKQILVSGDWAIHNKTGLGGAWAFQFDNDFYPDTDDSAVVIMALLQHPSPTPQLLASIQAGVRWLLTMQNLDGGWSAFEQGVDDEYVNMIAFNDMENWRDPSTADVTGRCLQMLAELDVSGDSPAVMKAIAFLQKQQTNDGSWFGRWGVNYIYGTWSVLMGLARYLTPRDPIIDKAVTWLQSIQNLDGGWGESCHSYVMNKYTPLRASTPSQTAWALLALMAASRTNTQSVHRGITWLLEHQNTQGTWDEPYFTGTGFPKHFYLRYDYYRHYFPLWALGEYFSQQNP